MHKENTKVHIVYCHPSDKSITFAIKEAFINTLRENDIEFTINDLYKSDFRTDISEEEYLRENCNIPCPLSQDVIEEQERINNADVLTFIFPLFWMDAPSKLVGYFSRVFTKGFKYESENNNESLMKTMDETIFLISAGSSYKKLNDDGKISALETVFINDRMIDKTQKSSMYFFCETTYNKEIELNNRENHIKKAQEIAKGIR